MSQRINYDGKVFRGRTNSANGEVGATTRFEYRQNGTLLTGTYSGGSVFAGQLLGVVHDDDTLTFQYHHLNVSGVLMAGRCESTPVLTDGRLIMHERWQWLTGDCSTGTSEVEEVPFDGSV